MTGIELTLYIGQYGERVERVGLPISESLARDLTEPVELSDEPFSLLLASPGLFGGKGDAVTIRRKKFKLRRETAREIAKAIEDKLVDLFGVNDEIDGYRKDERWAHQTPPKE